MKDKAHLHEVSKKVKTEKLVQGIALYNDDYFALIEGQVNKLHNDQFQEVENGSSDVQRLISL